jgi:hypothetical protein
LDVSVVTLASLVVVTKHAYSLDDEREAVFVRVSGAGRRTRQLPNNELGESTIPQDMPFLEQEPRSHRKKVSKRCEML